MISRLMPPLSRISLLIITAMMMAVLQPAVAANEATTSGGISVFNEGGLSVSFGESKVTFVTSSGGPAQITASTGDVQYAQIPITIKDDRADGARGPYTISLKLTSPHMAETPYYIDASNIAIAQVVGLPGGLQRGWIGDGGSPNSEIQETVVIRSGQDPPAGTHNVIVHVRMNVPAGTVPGTYVGNVQLTLNSDSFPD